MKTKIVKQKRTYLDCCIFTTFFAFLYFSLIMHIGSMFLFMEYLVDIHQIFIEIYLFTPYQHVRVSVPINVLMEQFLQENVPLRHMIHTKPSFIFQRRSAFNEVNT